MKKKLFLGALLLGALTLNSCVDNVESDSVKAVRQAKAEQLKAKADYDKALGEAAVISANAEKAAQEIAAKAQEAQAEYMKAQAEYQRALAAREQAYADYYAAQTEYQKALAAEALAKAELAAQEAQITLERHQAELEAYKKQMAAQEAQWEKQLYENQKQALEAKMALEKAIKDADKAHINELLELLEAYETAANDLLAAQKELATTKMTLSQYEAGLISPNESAERQIKNYTDANNNLQSQIDDAQAYIDTWRDYDYATAEAALEEAKKAMVDLKKDQTDKSNAWEAAKTTATNAKYALDGSEYANAIKKVKALGYNIASDSKSYLSVYQVTEGNGAPVEVLNDWCAVIYTFSTGEQTYIPLFSDVISDIKYVNYQVAGSSYVWKVNYTTYSEYYNLVAGGMDKLIAAVKDYVKNGAQKNYDDAKDEYDEQSTIVSNIQKLYDTLEPLEKAYTDAVDALANATSDPDGKLAKAKTDAEAAFAKAVKDQKLVAPSYLPNPQKLDDYLTANGVTNTFNLCSGALQSEKGTLQRDWAVMNDAENSLNKANKNIAAIEESAKTLSDGNEGNTAAMKAVNEANIAEAQANLALKEANNAVSVKQSEINALNAKIYAVDDNGNTISNMLSQKEQDIKNWTAQIESNNNEIARWQKALDAGTLDQQNTIDNLKAEIANQEAHVKVLEEKVKYAKEELDAAMKSEETPAE